MVFARLKRRGVVLASLATLVGLGLVGCGGDEGSDPTTSTATTTTTAGVPLDEFIAEADGICAEANAAIANLSGADTGAAGSTAITQQLEITQGVQSSLMAIGDPEDPEGAVSSFMTALDQQVQALRDQQEAISGGDSVAAETAASQLATAEAAAATAAEEVGLRECGGEGEALPTESTTTSANPSDQAATDQAAPTEPTPTEPAPPVEPVDPPANSGGTDSGGTAPGGPGGSSSPSGGIGPG